MMNAAKKHTSKRKSDPVLLSIFRKAEEDYKRTEEMFDLLGWGRLPAELKFAIETDVKAYFDELHGRYSTHCSYVQQRRDSIDFWVKSFLEDICSLETALEAVRIKPL